MPEGQNRGRSVTEDGKHADSPLPVPLMVPEGDEDKNKTAAEVEGRNDSPTTLAMLKGNGEQ